MDERRDDFNRLKNLPGIIFALALFILTSSFLSLVSANDYIFQNATGTNLTRISGDTGNLTVLGEISTSNTGFFGFLGSLLNRVTGLFAINGDISNNLTIGGNLSVAGNANITGPLYLGNSLCAAGYVLTADATTGLVSCTLASGLGGVVNGSGTYGYIPMWNATNTLNNSAIYQNGSKIGIGTTGPLGNLHISDGNLTNSSLITSDYAIISAQDTSPGFSIVSASNTSSGRAVFKGVRARGTLASPLVPSVDDDALTFLSALYDGSTTQATAGIFFKVDGAVSSGVAPQRISFVTSTTTGAARTEKMTIKSDGNVGIGTTSPASKVDIIKDAAGDTSFLQASSGITIASGTSGNPYQLRFLTDATQNLSAIQSQQSGISGAKLILNPNGGNVGIGIASPAMNLEVNGTAIYSRSSLGGISADNSRWFYLLAPSNAGSFADIIRQNSTSLRFATETTKGGGTFTTQMIIDPSGNVGIGTASPGRQLEINGSNPLLKFNGDPSGEAHTIGVDASGFVIWNDADNRYDLVIDNTGKFGINTSTPQNTLNVLGDFNATTNIYAGGDVRIAGSDLNIWGTGSGNEGGQINIGDPATRADGQTGAWSIDNNGGDLRIFYNSGFVRLSVDNNSGNVGVNTSTPQNALNVIGDINATSAIRTSNQLISSVATGTAPLSVASTTQVANLNVSFAGLAYNLSCTDCIDATEISDIYLLNSGDTATGNYTFDTDTFFIDSSNNRIGIGTTTPSTLLTLQTASASTGIRLNYTGTAATYTGLTINTGHGGNSEKWFMGTDGANTNADFIIRLNGTTNPFSIQRSSGEVGIGTTSPTVQLSINSSGAGGIDIMADSGTPVNSGRLFFSNGTSGQSFVLVKSGNAFSIRTGGTPGSSSGTERITLLDTGNVGINTTSPQNTLNVVGDANITGMLRDSSGGVSGANLIPISADAWRDKTTMWSLVSGSAATISIVDPPAGSLPVPTGKVHQFVNLSTTGEWYVVDQIIPINPNMTYYGRVWAARISGAGTFYAGYIAYNGTGSILAGNGGTYGYFIASAQTPAATGTWYYGKIGGEGAAVTTFPVGTRYIKPLVILNYNVGGTMQVGGFEISDRPFEQYNGVYDLATQGTSRFYIDSAGEIGIGTTSPSQKLDIQNTVSGTNTGLEIDSVNAHSFITFSNSTTSFWDIGKRDSAQSHRFYIFDQSGGGGSNSEVFTILKGGNVGIGTTSPGAQLEVNLSSGTEAFDKGIVIHSGDGSFTTGHGPMLQFENEDVIMAGIRGYREGGWQGALQFFTHNATSGNTYGTTFLERMRITSTGNVGIGTTAPQNTLNVIGTANFTGNTSSNTDFCIFGGKCLSAMGAGTMSSWILGATSGTNQTITNGDTAALVAGNAITTTAAATDIVTIAVTAGSIDDNEIAQGSIDATEIAASAINTTHILDGTILTADIASAQITAALIAAGVVNTTHILDSTILSADISDGTIAAADIAPNAINTTHIINGAILDDDISPSQINTTHILDGTILTGDIANSQITAALIAASAVNTTHILDGTILGADIASGTIVAADLAPSSVNTTHILDGTILNGDIANGQITNAKLTSDLNLGWANLTAYPTACSSSQYISAFGDTLTCASIAISDTQVTDAGKFLLATGDTATGNYTFDSGTFFIDSTNNRVGIGTTTPTSMFQVNGQIAAVTNTLYLSNLARVLASSSGMEGQATGGLEIGTSGTAPIVFYTSAGSEKMRILNSGNVGINTTSPQNTLNVVGIGNFTSSLYAGNIYPGSQTSDYIGWDGSGITKYGAGYTYISAGTFYVAGSSVLRGGISDDGGSLEINDDAYVSGSLTIGAGDADTGSHITVWDGAGDRIYTGFSGAQGGQYQIYAAGTGSGATAYFDSGGLNLNSNSISAVNKIDANTFDPVYTIDNLKYATYLPGIAGGVKEETTGTIMLTSSSITQKTGNNVNDKTSEYTIDFNNLEVGSDLWLFWQVTDFGQNMEKLQVILTPGFDGKAWYKKDTVKKKLTIYGDSSGEVSYRLTANRHDWKQWSNLALTNSTGMVLNMKK